MLLCVLILPELAELLGITWFHSSSTWCPGRWAHFTVLISVLESLHKAQSLVYTSTDWQITYGQMAQDTISIDDVGRAERDSSIGTIFNQATIVARNLVRHIREQRHIHRAETACFTLLLSVLHVGEVRVNRATNELRIDLFELACLVTELADLSGADKGKVKGPEEQADVFSYKTGLTD